MYIFYLDKSYQENCQQFSVAFRRVIRTLYDNNLLDIGYYYVDFTGKPKSSKTNVSNEHSQIENIG